MINEKKKDLPDKKIRYAIIGCGNIGPSHAEGVLACKDAELYAVCDIVEEKAKNMAAQYGAAYWFTDYKEMIQSEEIDIVSICTPSGMHGDMVLDCARAGKHVLCEKPIEISKGKMDAMIDGCTDAGVKLGVVFQNRTYSGTIQARKMIKNGELGRILIADGYCKEYRSPEYYRSASWRGTRALDGGGCLMNQGVHCIDLLCWFAGEVESVNGRVYTVAREIEVEDAAFAMIKFRNGALGVIEGSTVSFPGRDDHVEIQCEMGRIVYDSGHTSVFGMDNNEIMIETPLDTSKVEWSNTANDPLAFENTAHNFLVQDMVRAVIEDREPYITGVSARHAVDVILGIYESSEAGMEIRINE